MESISLVPTITLSIAVLGAVLGLVNTWHGLNNARVKLKVRPAHAIPVGGANPSLTFRIEVTNLSAFAVTVFDVGVFYRGTDQRGSVIQPVLIDGGRWPRRLEPRSSTTRRKKSFNKMAGFAGGCQLPRWEEDSYGSFCFLTGKESTTPSSIGDLRREDQIFSGD